MESDQLLDGAEGPWGVSPWATDAQLDLLDAFDTSPPHLSGMAESGADAKPKKKRQARRSSTSAGSGAARRVPAAANPAAQGRRRRQRPAASQCELRRPIDGHEMDTAAAPDASRSELFKDSVRQWLAGETTAAAFVRDFHALFGNAGGRPTEGTTAALRKMTTALPAEATAALMKELSRAEALLSAARPTHSEIVPVSSSGEGPVLVANLAAEAADGQRELAARTAVSSGSEGGAALANSAGRLAEDKQIESLASPSSPPDKVANPPGQMVADRDQSRDQSLGIYERSVDKRAQHHPARAPRLARAAQKVIIQKLAANRQRNDGIEKRLHENVAGIRMQTLAHAAASHEREWQAQAELAGLADAHGTQMQQLMRAHIRKLDDSEADSEAKLREGLHSQQSEHETVLSAAQSAAAQHMAALMVEQKAEVELWKARREAERDSLSSAHTTEREDLTRAHAVELDAASSASEKRMEANISELKVEHDIVLMQHIAAAQSLLHGEHTKALAAAEAAAVGQRAQLSQMHRQATETEQQAARSTLAVQVAAHRAEKEALVRSHTQIREQDAAALQQIEAQLVEQRSALSVEHEQAVQKTLREKCCMQDQHSSALAIANDKAAADIANMSAAHGIKTLQMNAAHASVLQHLNAATEGKVEHAVFMHRTEHQKELGAAQLLSTQQIEELTTRQRELERLSTTHSFELETCIKAHHAERAHLASIHSLALEAAKAVAAQLTETELASQRRHLSATHENANAQAAGRLAAEHQAVVAQLRASASALREDHAAKMAAAAAAASERAAAASSETAAAVEAARRSEVAQSEFAMQLEAHSMEKRALIRAHDLALQDVGSEAAARLQSELDRQSAGLVSKHEAALVSTKTLVSEQLAVEHERAYRTLVSSETVLQDVHAAKLAQMEIAISEQAATLEAAHSAKGRKAQHEHAAQLAAHAREAERLVGAQHLALQQARSLFTAQLKEELSSQRASLSSEHQTALLAVEAQAAGRLAAEHQAVVAQLRASASALREDHAAKMAAAAAAASERAAADEAAHSTDSIELARKQKLAVQTVVSAAEARLATELEVQWTAMSADHAATLLDADEHVRVLAATHLAEVAAMQSGMRQDFDTLSSAHGDHVEELNAAHEQNLNDAKSAVALRLEKELGAQLSAFTDEHVDALAKMEEQAAASLAAHDQQREEHVLALAAAEASASAKLEELQNQHKAVLKENKQERLANTSEASAHLEKEVSALRSRSLRERDEQLTKTSQADRELHQAHTLQLEAMQLHAAEQLTEANALHLRKNQEMRARHSLDMAEAEKAASVVLQQELEAQQMTLAEEHECALARTSSRLMLAKDQAVIACVAEAEDVLRAEHETKLYQMRAEERICRAELVAKMAEGKRATREELARAHSSVLQEQEVAAAAQQTKELAMQHAALVAEHKAAASAGAAMLTAEFLQHKQSESTMHGELMQAHSVALEQANLAADSRLKEMAAAHIGQLAHLCQEHEAKMAGALESDRAVALETQRENAQKMHLVQMEREAEADQKMRLATHGMEIEDLIVSHTAQLNGAKARASEQIAELKREHANFRAREREAQSVLTTQLAAHMTEKEGLLLEYRLARQEAENAADLHIQVESQSAAEAAAASGAELKLQQALAAMGLARDKADLQLSELSECHQGQIEELKGVHASTLQCAQLSTAVQLAADLEAQRSVLVGEHNAVLISAVERKTTALTAEHSETMEQHMVKTEAMLVEERHAHISARDELVRAHLLAAGKMESSHSAAVQSIVDRLLMRSTEMNVMRAFSKWSALWKTKKKHARAAQMLARHKRNIFFLLWRDLALRAGRICDGTVKLEMKNKRMKLDLITTAWRTCVKRERHMLAKLGRWKQTQAFRLWWSVVGRGKRLRHVGMRLCYLLHSRRLQTMFIMWARRNEHARRLVVLELRCIGRIERFVRTKVFSAWVATLAAARGQTAARRLAAEHQAVVAQLRASESALREDHAAKMAAAAAAASERAAAASSETAVAVEAARRSEVAQSELAAAISSQREGLASGYEAALSVAATSKDEHVCELVAQHRKQTETLESLMHREVAAATSELAEHRSANRQFDAEKQAARTALASQTAARDAEKIAFQEREAGLAAELSAKDRQLLQLQTQLQQLSALVNTQAASVSELASAMSAGKREIEIANTKLTESASKIQRADDAKREALDLSTALTESHADETAALIAHETELAAELSAEKEGTERESYSSALNSLAVKAADEQKLAAEAELISLVAGHELEKAAMTAAFDAEKSAIASTNDAYLESDVRALGAKYEQQVKDLSMLLDAQAAAAADAAESVLVHKEQADSAASELIESASLHQQEIDALCAEHASARGLLEHSTAEQTTARMEAQRASLTELHEETLAVAKHRVRAELSSVEAEVSSQVAALVLEHNQALEMLKVMAFEHNQAAAHSEAVQERQETVHTELAQDVAAHGADMEELAQEHQRKIRAVHLSHLLHLPDSLPSEALPRRGAEVTTRVAADDGDAAAALALESLAKEEPTSPRSDSSQESTESTEPPDSVAAWDGEEEDWSRKVVITRKFTQLREELYEDTEEPLADAERTAPRPPRRPGSTPPKPTSPLPNLSRVRQMLAAMDDTVATPMAASSLTTSNFSPSSMPGTARSAVSAVASSESAVSETASPGKTYEVAAAFGSPGEARTPSRLQRSFLGGGWMTPPIVESAHEAEVECSDESAAETYPTPDVGNASETAAPNGVLGGGSMLGAVPPSSPTLPPRDQPRGQQGAWSGGSTPPVSPATMATSAWRSPPRDRINTRISIHSEVSGAAVDRV